MTLVIFFETVLYYFHIEGVNMALAKEDLQAMESDPILAILDRIIELYQDIRASQLRVELELFPRVAATIDKINAALAEDSK